MSPYAFGAVCVAAVLGTLSVEPLDPGIRVVVAAGAALLGCVAIVRADFAFARAARAVAFAIGALNAQWRHDLAQPVFERRTARYEGAALQARAGDDGSSAFTFAISGGPAVEVQVRGTPPPLGVPLVVRGRLEPFDDARNPGETSEREIQSERGLSGRLAHADVVSVRPRAYANTPDAALARAHAWAMERLRERLGDTDAAILAGELWGERGAVPPDLRAEFQETGTIHVLVTAGLHLGVVAAIAFWILSFAGLPRAWTCAVVTAIVWAFVAWSGAQLPAVRAATMLTAALAARACGRPALSWNVLAFAAAAIALARPPSVAGASFALSFSCVAAIFVCARPLERLLSGWIALPNRVREAAVLTLATQLGTWPLTAAVFLQFSPYALVANFCIVPFVGVTMILGALQLALAWCAPLAQAAANLTSWSLAWTLAVVRALSAANASTIPMTPAPAWCIAAYDVAVYCAVRAWQRGAWQFAAIALLAGVVLTVAPPRLPDGRLRITVLDVGQADSIAVQTPGGEALLIDGGGRLERGASPGSDSQAELVGERTVVPFLLRCGIHRLDALILTHPHGDHAGGVAPVLRKLSVGEIADGGQRYGGHAYRDAIDLARAQRVPIVTPRAGDVWRTPDGVTLRFVGPSLPLVAGSRNDINENSIAFLLEYRSFRMLFTGDAGAAAEQRFLAEGVDLRADVLKVGHHGSAYGSTPAFLAAVHPRYAVISVGRHNLFGHPAPVTLDALQNAGARIYRTDEDGAVVIATDGTGVGITSMIGDGGR